MYKKLLHATAAFIELDISSARSLLNALAAPATLDLSGRLQKNDEAVQAALGTVLVIDASERAIHLLTVGSRENIVGKTLDQIFARSGHRACADALVTTLHRQGDELVDFRLQSLEGKAIHVSLLPSPHAENVTLLAGLSEAEPQESSSSPLMLGGERYHDFFRNMPISLTMIDARAMVQLFARLKQSKVTNLNAYLDANPDVFEYAMDSVLVAEANLCSIRQFGASRASDMLRPVRCFWADAPETFRRTLIARYEGAHFLAEETRMRTLDGRTIDVLFSMAFPAPQDLRGVSLCATLDISDRIRAKTELDKMRSEFAHAARVSILGELTASIAHEITQPLTAIAANGDAALRWLSREVPDVEQAKSRCVRIVTDVHRANDIIQRIRNMVTKSAPELVPVDLNTLVRDALLIVRHEMQTSAIDISTKLKPDLTAVVGDRIQLQQVVVNLLINSIQAVSLNREVPRAIHVATYLDDNGRPVVAVRDTGPGIDLEDISHVFTGFYTTKKNGMGIGLSICQSIVAAHGGTISAMNNQEGGANFYFGLPPGPRSSW